MKSVLIVNTLYPPSQVGGAEKSVSLLAEAMVRAGNRVVCVCLHGGNSELKEAVNGVDVIRLPLDNIYWPYEAQKKPSQIKRLLWHVFDMWNFKAAKRVGKILDDVQPDVIHTNNLTGFSVSIWHEAKRRGIPIVHTLRDYSLACSRAALFRNNKICEQRCFDCSVLTQIRKNASRDVDQVASNSGYVIAAHERHGYFPHVPSKVIYNIADLKARPTAANTPTDQHVFGFIGRIEEEKGIEVVLEATQRLKTGRWRLVIAGRGLTEYVEGLKARYSDPRIDWAGFMSPEMFYSSIDTALIASVWPEPLPRTLIESFAYGRSAICARSGGIPEIAARGPQVAEYDPHDIERLASLMDEAVMNAPLWKAARAADPAFFAAFSEQEVVREYSSLYSSAAERSDQETAR